MTRTADTRSEVSGEGAYAPEGARQEKPHLGRIAHWYKSECSDGISYVIRGEFLDHPEFMGLRGHTSRVVKHDGDEIETRNSRYTLVHHKDQIAPATPADVVPTVPHTPAVGTPSLGSAPLGAEVAAELVEALRDIAAWSENCVKVMEFDGSRMLATGLEQRRRIALALLSKLKGSN